MKNPDSQDQSGLTGIELAVVLAILSIALLSAFTVVDESGSFVGQSMSRLKTDETNRLALVGLVDLITESSMLSMDTSMRVHDSMALSDIHSDRFTFAGLTYSQCVSPVCRFHTESGTRLDDFRYRCGLEYRVTTLTSVMARGKVWPGALSACPLDGSPTTSLVSMDCLKFLSARGRDGAFTTGGVNGLEPQWDTLVILAPYADTRGEGELRRYDIGVGDLLAGLVVSSGNSPIDAAVPDMIRLFDFGTDGTTNGIPDGLVPVTAATSDAERESFFAGTYLGEAAVIITKNLGSPTTYPRRVLNLVVRLRDGFTTFSVGHNESAMVFWTASCTFTREPTVLVNKLTEFTASTAASNPFNAMTNPDGISDSSVVRMTLATTDNWISKGESLWNHSVQELVLKPRN